MKKWLMVFLLVIFLAACAKQAAVPEQTVSQEPQQVEIKSTLQPAFKIIQESGRTKSPPAVFGKVKNIGNATGSVKLTAKVYYAQVISDENSVTVNNVEPGQIENFSIDIDEVAQWTSYKIFLEPVD